MVLNVRFPLCTMVISPSAYITFTPKYLYLPTVSLCSMTLQTAALQGAPSAVVLFVNDVKKIFDYYIKKKTAT